LVSSLRTSSHWARLLFFIGLEIPQLGFAIFLRPFKNTLNNIILIISEIYLISLGIIFLAPYKEDMWKFEF